MNLTSLVFLFCLLCAAGYILFGALQMIRPQKAFPIYRFFLGKRRYDKAEARFAAVKPFAWKILGVGYILFGMLVTLALMRSFRAP